MIPLAYLIYAGFLALAVLALLGFPGRTPVQCRDHAINLLHEALQRRCEHERAVADVLQGDVPDIAVRHCARCGAVKVVYGCISDRNADGEWRRPRATSASAVLGGAVVERGA